MNWAIGAALNRLELGHWNWSELAVSFENGIRYPLPEWRINLNRRFRIDPLRIRHRSICLLMSLKTHVGHDLDSASLSCSTF